MGRPRNSSVGLAGERRSMVGEERRSAAFGGKMEEVRVARHSRPLHDNAGAAATGRSPLGRAPRRRGAARGVRPRRRRGSKGASGWRDPKVGGARP